MDTLGDPLIDSEDEGAVSSRRTKPYNGRKWFTVEPSLVLFFMALMPSLPLMQQFVLDELRSRRNITVNSNYSLCVMNYSDPLYETESSVEKEATQWMMLLTAVTLVPSAFVTTILGSYSDQVGRKIAMYPPLVGGILQCVLTILIIIFKLPLELLILASLATGLTGGIGTFLMACFASVSDITTHRNRTFRVFILELHLGMGAFLGQVGAGYVIKLLGYMYPFIIIACLYAINLVYTIFLLPESRPGDAKNVPFFTLVHFKKMWYLYAKDNEHGKQWKMLICTLLLLAYSTVDIGGGDVLSFFVLSAPLCLSSVLLGFFQGYLFLAKNLCGLVAVALCARRLGDIGLMFLSCVSGIAFSLLMAFTKTHTMLFFAPVAEIFGMLLLPMIRSFTSKLVPPEDLGTLFAALGFSQALSIVLGDVIFNTVYSATLEIYKPLVFFIEAGVLFIGVILTCVLFFGVRRERRNLSIQVTDVEEHI